VQASGHEKVPQARTFTLENVRIEGALLTASRVYQDGTTEAFEGVFLKRTDRTSPTDPGVTTFGLGVVIRTPFETNGLTYEKLFYRLKQ
jgi:Ca2+-binding RTX toxin-like protein